MKEIRIRLFEDDYDRLLKIKSMSDLYFLSTIDFLKSIIFEYMKVNDKEKKT